MCYQEKRHFLNLSVKPVNIVNSSRTKELVHLYRNYLKFEHTISAAYPCQPNIPKPAPAK